MKIACPKCFWATDDVQITLTDTDHKTNELSLMVKCNRKGCGASYLAQIKLDSLREFVPA